MVKPRFSAGNWRFLVVSRTPAPHRPPERGPRGGVELDRKNTWFFRPLCSRPVKNRDFLAAKHPRKPVRFGLSEGGIRWHGKTRHFCAGRAAAAGKMQVFEGTPAKTRAFCGPARKTGNPSNVFFAHLVKSSVFSRSKCDPASAPPSPILQRSPAQPRIWPAPGGHRGGGLPRENASLLRGGVRATAVKGRNPSRVRCFPVVRRPRRCGSGVFSRAIRIPDRAWQKPRVFGGVWRPQNPVFSRTGSEPLGKRRVFMCQLGPGFRSALGGRGAPGVGKMQCFYGQRRLGESVRENTLFLFEKAPQKHVIFASRGGVLKWTVCVAFLQRAAQITRVFPVQLARPFRGGAAGARDWENTGVWSGTGRKCRVFPGAGSL